MKTPRLRAPASRASLYAPLVALLSMGAACAPELSLAPRVSALVSLEVDPPAEPSATIDRTPVFSLRFLRPMPALDEGLWLIDGPASDSLRSDARRGALSSGNAARRLDAAVRRHPTEPRVLQVSPRAPLWPGQSITLVTTARLVGEDGLVASDDEHDPRPIVRTFRVCASPDCRPLATLSTPASEEAPTELRAIVVRFDRAITQSIEGPALWLVRDADGEEIPGAAYLACREGRAYRCARFEPDVPLEPEREHRVELGALVDSEGRMAAPRALSFRTGRSTDARRPTFVPQPACAPGELSRPPVCVEVSHDAIVVHGRSDTPAVLRVRGGEWTAESDLATILRARLQSASAAHVPLVLSLLGADGVVSSEARIDPIVTPAPVCRLRISEVYARPRGSSAQEFVEVVNDDTVPCSLEGFHLRTTSGASALPDAWLAPGDRAVIVGPSYEVRGDARAGDPPLSPGATLVRLARTLVGRGLADRGADVWIEDRGGFVCSRAPLSHPARTPRVGVSLVRADTTMDERDPASWMYDAGDGATPGGPDRVR